MIEGKWIKPGDDTGDAGKVRETVFGTSSDSLDSEAWNVVVYMDKIPAACGRIWWKDGAYCLGDIGVIPQLRRRKLGDLILRLLIFKAQSHSASLLHLTSPESLTPFFARLGFVTVKNDAGECLMELKGQDICLDTCKSCSKNCPNRREE